MSLTKSNEYTETWLQRTWPGVIPTAIIVCLIAIVAMTANAIKYYRYKSAWFSRQKKSILGENLLPVDPDDNSLP